MSRRAWWRESVVTGVLLGLTKEKDTGLLGTGADHTGI